MESEGLLSGEKQPVSLHTGWFASAFLVVNGVLGTGFFNFPSAYSQAGGLLSAITVQTVVLLFVFTTLPVLCYCSDLTRTDTYQDTVRSLCGPTTSHVTSISIIISMFGTGITCLIFIGDVWEIFFISVSSSVYCDSRPFYMTRAFMISMSSILLILPLCFYRKIDALKYSSLVGIVGILYIAALLVVKFFSPRVAPISITTKPKSLLDAFLVAPAIFFSYDVHVEIIPIYSCMKKRTLYEVSKTLALGLGLTCLMYSSAGVLGYLQFGDAVNENILLSFDQDVAVNIAVVLTAVKMCTTFPLFLFCGRQGIVSLWTTVWKVDDNEINEKRSRILITLMWFSASLVLAVALPTIGVTIRLVGSLSALLELSIPGLCFLVVIRRHLINSPHSTKKMYTLAAFAVSLILVGVFVFGLTLAQTIITDFLNDRPDESLSLCRTNPS